MGIFQSEPKHKFLYERAMQKTRNGDMDGALTDFSALIQIAPDLADAYFKRGYILLRKGDLKAAAPDFERALNLDPKHNDAAMMREMLKRHADLNRREVAQGKLVDAQDKAAKQQTPASAQEMMTPQYYLERGESRYENGQIEEAIDDFVDAIKLDVNYVDAYVNLGAIYHEYGEDELAQQYFTAALNLDPDHPDAAMMRDIVGTQDR